MISTNDFKKGTRFEHEGAPWQVMEVTVHNPSARGAATLVKAKSRNLKTDQVLVKTFKSGEMFEEPDLNKIRVQYLYDEGEDVVFMDNETYEQFNVARSMFGESAAWFGENFELELLQYNGQFIQFELPNSVVATVSSIEMGAKGDTASGKVLSRCRLENGVEVMVPSFIKEGSVIRVDPTENAYLGRES